MLTGPLWVSWWDHSPIAPCRSWCTMLLLEVVDMQHDDRRPLPWWTWPLVAICFLGFFVATGWPAALYNSGLFPR